MLEMTTMFVDGGKLNDCQVNRYFMISWGLLKISTLFKCYVVTKFKDLVVDLSPKDEPLNLDEL